MRTALFQAILLGGLALVVSCASAPTGKPGEEAAQALPEAELARAKDLNQRIDNLGLGDYARTEYTAGLKSLKTGEDAYGKDNAASKRSLDDAIGAFTAVIAKGGPLYLGKAREQTLSSKKAADDAKAAVAVKDDYAKASQSYDRAEKDSAAGDIESAAKGYASARDLFSAAAARALQKRAKAQQALRDADTALSASEQKAADSQKSLQAEGFGVSSGSQ